MRSEGFYVNEKSTDTSWDRTDQYLCKMLVLFLLHQIFSFLFFSFLNPPDVVWINFGSFRHVNVCVLLGGFLDPVQFQHLGEQTWPI